MSPIPRLLTAAAESARLDRALAKVAPEEKPGPRGRQWAGRQGVPSALSKTLTRARLRRSNPSQVCSSASTPKLLCSSCSLLPAVPRHPIQAIITATWRSTRLETCSCLMPRRAAHCLDAPQHSRHPPLPTALSPRAISMHSGADSLKHQLAHCFDCRPVSRRIPTTSWTRGRASSTTITTCLPASAATRSVLQRRALN